MIYVLAFVMMWLGMGPPSAHANHTGSDSHTQLGTVITSNAVSLKLSWMLKATNALFGDSRTVYSDTAYDTVRMLSAVDVTANLETAFIGPNDSYVFVKHIRNTGNAYDTFRLRADSTFHAVRLVVDIDGDSFFDATDPPNDSVILKDFTETVVLLRIKAADTAADGRVDTLYFSATSNAAASDSPSAETVTLVLTLDSQPPSKPTLTAPANGLDTNSQRPAFSWSASTDSGAGLAYYIFEIDTSGQYTSVVLTDTRTTTSFTPSSDLAFAKYYWRVRAHDTVGNKTTGTESFVLTIDSGVSVVLASPADNHETNILSIQYTWISADAETYTWQLSRTAAFTTIADSVVDTKVTSFYRNLPAEDSFYWRVIARDTGSTFDTTTARLIMLDSSVAQVSALLPANNHDTTNAKVVVSWTALTDSAGIDSYAVEVSKSSSFTSLVFSDTVDGLRTSDTILGLFNDTYYWRVRGIDDLGNGGTFSTTRRLTVDTFVKQISLATPAYNAISTDSSPALTWSAVTDSVGIDSYVVEVSSRPTFDSLIFHDTVDGLLTTDTTSDLADSIYYWRVRAVDQLGNAGSNSESFVLTITGGLVVTLNAPAAGAETGAAAVFFKWTGSSTAETYTWQVSRVSTFATLTDSVVDTTSTSLVKAFAIEDTYYWRVVGKDRSNNTETSTTRLFVFDTTTDRVSALSPSSGHETSNAKIVVSWSALGDSSGIDSYAIEVSKSGTFTGTFTFTDTVDGLRTSDTILGLFNDTYYWRVRAIDDLGNGGAYSTTRGFVVDTTAGQVTALSPVDGHETSNAKVVVSWSAVTADSVGIDSYVVEVSKSGTFTGTLTFTDTVGGLRTSDTILGLFNDTYYWRVRAIDRLGNAGSNSTVRGFLVDTQTPSVSLVSPAAAVNTRDSTPTFNWSTTTDSSGVDSHVVEVARDSAFTILKFTDTVDGTKSYDTVNTAGMPYLPEDTYYWRVIAIDNAGNTMASSIYSFVLDTSAPDSFSLSAPTDSHDTSNLKPVFKWSASGDSRSGIYGYRLELSTTAQFTTYSRIDTVIGGSITETGPPTDLLSDTYYWRVIAIDNAGNTVAASNGPRKISLINPTASVKFDKLEYKGLKDIAQIRLTDPLANLLPAVIETADVTVFSDIDPTGFTMTLTESEANSGLFVGTIQFTGGITDASSRKIRVNPGSGFFAKRTQSNGSVVSGSATWLNEAGTTPPADVEKTRSWPNPWNPTSGQPLIIQNLPADPSMTIEIYTMDMKKIRTLYNGNGISASLYGNAASWDGKNDGGSFVSSGVYLYVVRSSSGTTMKKITLVK